MYSSAVKTTVANGKLFLRDRDKLHGFDLLKPGAKRRGRIFFVRREGILFSPDLCFAILPFDWE